MHISSNHQYLLFKWSPTNNTHRPSQSLLQKPQNRTSNQSHKPLQVGYPIQSLQPTIPHSTHKQTEEANSVIPQTPSLLDSPSTIQQTPNSFAHIPLPTNPPIQRTTTRTHYPLTAPNLQTPSSPSQQWVTPSHYPANSSYCRVANGKSTYRTIRITSAHRPPVMFIFTVNTSWIRSAFCNSISQPHNRWR